MAEIVVDTQGLVSEVRILESPDQEIARSVEEAVKQWTFMPQTVKGAPISLRSKLTFYFVRNKAKGRVLHPEEMAREMNETRN